LPSLPARVLKRLRVQSVGGAGRAACDPVKTGFGGEVTIFRELAIEPAVVDGVHRAAAAPVLVADADVADVKGVGMAVFGPEAGQRGVAGAVQVLEPVAHLLWRTFAAIMGSAPTWRQKSMNSCVPK